MPKTAKKGTAEEETDDPETEASRQSSQHEDEGARSRKGTGGTGGGSGDDAESALSPKDIEAIKNMKISERFDKLDRDYFLYLSLIYSTMKSTRLDAQDVETAWAWIQKIVSMPTNSVEDKREKNIYFLYLLFQLRENRLKGVFSRKPVQGSLNRAAEAFHGVKSPEKDKNYENKFLEADSSLGHKSTDGRTYMASKILNNNAGVCCYVAVSSGLKDPVWITPCGDKADVKPRDDLAVTVVRNCEGKTYMKKMDKNEGLMEVEAQRKSFDERYRLTAFYQDVINRINAEMKKLMCRECTEVEDPVLLQMIRRLKNEAIACGQCISEPPLDLLRRLKEKSLKIIQEAECREKEIENLSGQIGETDLRHKLVDLSSNIALDPDDDVWLAAIQEEPSPYVVHMLQKNYQQCVIDALLMLLERQRQIIIDQEKQRFEEILFSLKSELEEHVQIWKKEYGELRLEWAKVIKVLRDIEHARDRLKEDNANVEAPFDAKKSSAAKRQLDEALEAYQNARAYFLKTERKSNVLQCKLEEAQKLYLDSKNDLKREAESWTATICALKREIEMQEMLIKDLQGH